MRLRPGYDASVKTDCAVIVMYATCGEGVSSVSAAIPGGVSNENVSIAAPLPGGSTIEPPYVPPMLGMGTVVLAGPGAMLSVIEVGGDAEMVGIVGACGLELPLQATGTTNAHTAAKRRMFMALMFPARGRL